ncbi:hypothetical protein ScPMuIL_008786 [Solemya velum]
MECDEWRVKVLVWNKVNISGNVLRLMPGNILFAFANLIGCGIRRSVFEMSLGVFLLSIVIAVPSICYESLQGPRLLLNRRSVKSRALGRACQSGSCRNMTCDNPDGWHLWGSDWGCCGNYDSCCVTASVVCYVHDVICKCCEYGVILCGPTCKKEPDCPKNETEQTPEISNELPTEKIEKTRQHKVTLLSDTNNLEANRDGVVAETRTGVGPNGAMQQDDAHVDDSGSGETWFWGWD